MPSLYRVDPRLVHATLINAWVPALDASSIVIADAQVEQDPRRRAIYKISAMELLPVHFCAQHEAQRVVERLEEPQRAIVLFSDLGGALEAARAHLTIPKLLIGHVPASDERKELHPSVHLGPSEMEQIQALESMQVEV